LSIVAVVGSDWAKELIRVDPNTAAPADESAPDAEELDRGIHPNVRLANGGAIGLNSHEFSYGAICPPAHGGGRFAAQPNQRRCDERPR
jgi:hypothetical protein